MADIDTDDARAEARQGPDIRTLNDLIGYLVHLKKLVPGNTPIVPFVVSADDPDGVEYMFREFTMERRHDRPWIALNVEIA